ncbi:hypothetical protein AMTR_s00032p00218950, partial [Amborella trichopoda]
MQYRSLPFSLCKPGETLWYGIVETVERQGQLLEDEGSSRLEQEHSSLTIYIYTPNAFLSSQKDYLNHDELIT